MRRAMASAQVLPQKQESVSMKMACIERSNEQNVTERVKNVIERVNEQNVTERVKNVTERVNEQNVTERVAATNRM